MEEKTKQPHKGYAPVVQAQQALAHPVAQIIKAATSARPGQPTLRNEAVVEEILDRIANGEALINICQDEHLPGYSTFNRWQREDPELLMLVDIAYQFHARTMDDMADSILAGGIGSTGEFKRDEARVAHLRYRLGKLNRRFADKQQIDVVHHEPVILDWHTIEGPGGDGV